MPTKSKSSTRSAGKSRRQAEPLPVEAAATGLARLGVRSTNWAERWFPDAYVFICLAVAVVRLGGSAEWRRTGPGRENLR